MKYPPQSKVEAKLREALDRLFEHDAYLLEHDANERSISHRLACWLQEEFPCWHVDCEYNLDRHVSKRIDGKLVYPDIIVHQRGTKKNLLVIEIKKMPVLDDEREGPCQTLRIQGAT